MANSEGYKEGTKFEFQDLEFFACCGFIRIIDRRDGHKQDLSLVTFWERAEALAGGLKRGYIYHDEKREAVNMINAVKTACKEAAEMGDPFDPDVQAYNRRHETFKKVYAQVPGVGEEAPGVNRRASGLLVASK